MSIDILNILDSSLTIQLSNHEVRENAPIGTAVGELSVHSNDIFTFRLVENSNFPCNEKFRVSGSLLETNSMFDFEEMQKCYIKIRAVDSAALSYEVVFQISIRDQYDTTKIILDNAYLN